MIHAHLKGMHIRKLFCHWAVLLHLYELLFISLVHVSIGVTRSTYLTFLRLTLDSLASQFWYLQVSVSKFSLNTLYLVKCHNFLHFLECINHIYLSGPLVPSPKYALWFSRHL